MWSRNYSKRNTRLLRKLLETGAVVPDCEQGRVLRRNGIPFATTENHFGYVRFRVSVKKRGKWVNAWFFVHKAIFFSQKPKLRKHYEINHIDHNPRNNRLSNLEYVHRSQNRPRPLQEVEPAF